MLQLRRASHGRAWHRSSCWGDLLCSQRGAHRCHRRVHWGVHHGLRLACGWTSGTRRSGACAGGQSGSVGLMMSSSSQLPGSGGQRGPGPARTLHRCCIMRHATCGSHATCGTPGTRRGSVGYGRGILAARRTGQSSRTAQSRLTLHVLHWHGLHWRRSRGTSAGLTTTAALAAAALATTWWEGWLRHRTRSRHARCQRHRALWRLRLRIGKVDRLVRRRINDLNGRRLAWGGRRLRERGRPSCPGQRCTFARDGHRGAGGRGTRHHRPIAAARRDRT